MMPPSFERSPRGTQNQTMPKSWERSLQRWVEARLVDPETAQRIRAFETNRERSGGRRSCTKSSRLPYGNATTTQMLCVLATDQELPEKRLENVRAGRT